MIPNTDFITTFLNIRDSDLEYFFVSTENGKTYYNVQLKRKLFSCPYCRCETIGYGHRTKTIYHPVLRDTNGYIKYNANRYLCKGCDNLKTNKRIRRKRVAIMTTGSAGGLYCPYKGLLPATSQDVLNYSPIAHPFLQALKGYLFFFPVNGSIYSFKLIWSSAISS